MAATMLFVTDRASKDYLASVTASLTVSDSLPQGPANVGARAYIGSMNFSLPEAKTLLESLFSPMRSPDAYVVL